MHTFIETQHFRQWWLWALLVAVTVITFGAVVLTTGFDLIALVSLTGPVLALLSFYVVRLDTRIDQIGIQYRFFPLTGWRSIPWSGIRKSGVYPCQFVGYGIRWDGDGWHYNIDGQWGLHIDRVNGKRLVVGTQRPDELREFLRSFQPQNQA